MHSEEETRVVDESGVSKATAGVGNEPVAQSLFRDGQVYEIVGEFDAGSPLVMLPQNYQELTHSEQLATEPLPRFYLLGQVRSYLHGQECTPVFDVDRVIPAVGHDLPAGLIGVMQIERSVDGPAMDVVRQPVPVVEGVVLRVFPGHTPEAFILDAKGHPQPAGLLVYQPVPPSASLQAPAERSIKIAAKDLKRENSQDVSDILLAERTPTSIHVGSSQTQPVGRPVAITPEDLKEREMDKTIGVAPQPAPTIQVSRLPFQRGLRLSGLTRIGRKEVPGGKKPLLDVSLLRKLRPGAFREPVLCAYRGHLLTEPAEPCPVCEVVVCQACRDEAGGCITVGCPNSLCRDERPNLDLGELED